MAQLSFHYGAMGSGKSFELLKTIHNYTEQGKLCLAYKSAIDDRAGDLKIGSRVNGMSITAKNVTSTIYSEVKKISKKEQIFCILVDEVQFLDRTDIKNLARIVDNLDIPVMCFGLKTDFKGNLFPGSKALMELSDKLLEIKTVCVVCNRKATMNVRTIDGKAVYEGEQVQVGANEYFCTCRDCYNNFNTILQITTNPLLTNLRNKQKKTLE